MTDYKAMGIEAFKEFGPMFSVRQDARMAGTSNEAKQAWQEGFEEASRQEWLEDQERYFSAEAEDARYEANLAEQDTPHFRYYVED